MRSTLAVAVIGLVLGAGTMLLGCGDDEPAPAGDDAAATESSAAWQEGGGEQWEKVLEAGRQEGKLILEGGPTLSQSSFADDFERDTGITLEVTTGEWAARQTSMQQEAQANRLSIDLTLGGPSELREMLPYGLLNPIKDQLLLPGATDPANWKGDGIKWVDKEGEYLLQGSESKLTAWTVINSDEVDPAEIDTWEKLLDPQFKGKIAGLDPKLPDAGLALAASWAAVYGVDFVTDLYVGQDVKLSANKRQLIDWVARGTYGIALGTSPVDTKRFQDEGINLRIINPPDGPQFLTGAESVLKQPRNKNGELGPHPNAAQVFINWFASKPGQIAYNRAALDVSRRTDVPLQPGVDKSIVPDEGRESLDGTEWKFYLEERPKIAEELVQALGT
jgi:ABC-type Fe3+ transport system substrate-binding protein